MSGLREGEGRNDSSLTDEGKRDGEAKPSRLFSSSFAIL